MSSNSPKSNSVSARWEIGFVLAAGILCGLAPLKFGNPVIFERMLTAPSKFSELVFESWPVAWGYPLIALVCILGWRLARFQVDGPRWILFLPLIWLFWQFLSATQTIDPELTSYTLPHQAAIVVCFYVGLFALSRVKDLSLLWICISVGLFLVFWAGFQQHYGGLEQLRSIPREEVVRMLKEELGLTEIPPLLEMRLQSNRIFGTLVYPNALAGVIIFMLPICLTALWRFSVSRGSLIQKIILGLLAYMGAACLFWSGSKAGWLIALAMVLLIFLHAPMPRKIKIGLAAGICALGLVGFAIKYSDYFKEGATSVGARLDYWRAGAQTFLDHPLLGSGPGTFGPSYQARKAPESEMAHLAHNDYLEQASDSGIIGFMSYALFIFSALFLLYRKRGAAKDPMLIAVWLGLFGWALQGFVEFGLYIPALSWTVFLLLGWSWGVVFFREEENRTR